MIEVIAEIGVNHNGDLTTAIQLIEAANHAGCNAAKFQLWNTERVYPRERWDEMKRLELSRHDIAHLKTYCDQRGIEFLCTPDEIEDARFLKEIGVKRIKTSSQDITNIPFLIEVAKLGLPMIVSTGACDLIEMDEALARVLHHSIVHQHGARPTILHCVSAYPAPVEQMNLAVISYLRKTWSGHIGFSDHSSVTHQRSFCALLAFGLGARVFERHLTLDSEQPGPDHKASLEPSEMFSYVRQLQIAAEACGDGIKRVMPCEVENRKRYEDFIAPRKASA